MQFLLTISTILVFSFFISNDQFFDSIFAQFQTDNLSNTSNIDATIVNFLNQLGRENLGGSDVFGSIINTMNLSNGKITLNLQNSSDSLDSSILSIQSGSNLSTNSPQTIQTNKAEDSQKFFAKFINKDNNKVSIVSSNSLTEFNNSVSEFCEESGLDSSFCTSVIQESIQETQFTDSYIGPSKFITDLDQYSMEVSIN